MDFLNLCFNLSLIFLSELEKNILFAISNGAKGYLKSLPQHVLFIVMKVLNCTKLNSTEWKVCFNLCHKNDNK